MFVVKKEFLQAYFRKPILCLANELVCSLEYAILVTLSTQANHNTLLLVLNAQLVELRGITVISVIGR